MPDCACSLDSDGQCQSCRTTLFREIKDLLDIQLGAIRRMQEKADGVDKVCSTCKNRYLDISFGRVISAVAAEFTRFPERMLRGIVHEYIEIMIMIGSGISAFPHTEKAWEDVCSSRGWNP